MMIVTAKVQWKKCVLVLLGAAVILCGVIVAAGFLGHGPAASAIAAFSVKDGKDDAQRVAYLNSFGWEVEEDPVTVEDILIPEEEELSGESYASYLALQEECGFDLSRYAGKTVTRYSYRITNYPSGQEGVLAGLLVYRDRIIGGDVMSPELDGFIHSLNMPQ